jgi:hypothetical protein
MIADLDSVYRKTIASFFDVFRAFKSPYYMSNCMTMRKGSYPRSPKIKDNLYFKNPNTNGNVDNISYFRIVSSTSWHT